MLFQYTPDGLKRVEGKPQSSPPKTVKLAGYETQMEEVLPGQTVHWNISHPLPYLDNMVAGERYELFWPGAEYALWAWGTLRDNWDQQVGVEPELPRVVIPRGACCSITCVEQEDISDSQPYDDPPVEKSARM
ncbi:hypothetical protein PENSUB_6974 [Penicillium subrubescens]|uniref:Uncharacterized protein n=1 Tax=Penicillium subrubescens TaxID=1316194 RepID=A0A1Q5TRP8_9EURO|nr:hypothetical protein PENSUB_6974 [Penicillium subrubescens]